MNPGKIVDANQQLSELLNRPTNTGEMIILTADGKPKAVLLGVETFEELLRMREYSQRPLMPVDNFQKQFQEALIEAGYDSHEKIVNLVQEVKREMAIERQQKLSSNIV